MVNSVAARATPLRRGLRLFALSLSFMGMAIGFVLMPGSKKKAPKGLWLVLGLVLLLSLLATGCMRPDPVSIANTTPSGGLDGSTSSSPSPSAPAPSPIPSPTPAPAPAPQTFTVTITGTSGGIQQSASVAVTVN
jgi:hypothetical protein